MFGVFTTMDGVVEDFIKSPSESGLDVCTNKQMLLLADHYRINVDDARLGKERILLHLRSDCQTWVF